MLKKTFIIFTAFMLSLTCIAQSESFKILNIETPFPLMNEVIYTNDAIFLHTMDGSLYKWGKGFKKFKKQADLPFLPEDFEYPIIVEDMTDEELENFKHTILRVLSDGDKLYGINAFTGTWAEIKQDGTLIWQKNLLNSALIGEDSPGRQSAMFIYDGTLYALSEKEEEKEDPFPLTFNLIYINLADGESDMADSENIISAAPYKDGTLLVLVKDFEGGGASLKRFNKNSFTKLNITVPQAESYDALAYDSLKDVIYLAVPGELLVCSDGKNFETLGSMPFEFLPGGTRGGIINGNLYAVSMMDEILLYNTENKAEQEIVRLNLRGNAIIDKQLNAVSEPNLIINFNSDPITPDEAAKELISKNSFTDIYFMPFNAKTYALIKKGYAADLSSSQIIKDYFNELYPNIKNMLGSKNGAVMAYPVNINISYPSVDLKLFKELFPDEKLPETYGEFVKLMLKYTQENGDAEPQAYFMADTSAKDLLFEIIKSYIRYYEMEDAPLSFDNPELKDILIDIIKIIKLHEASGFTPQQIIGTNISDEDIKPELFILKSGGIAKSFENNGNLMPFTFTLNQEPHIEAYLNVLIINPYSENKDAAIRLAQSLLKKELDPVTYTYLHPGCNEPIENPFIERDLEGDKETVRLIQQALDEAVENNESEETISLYKYRLQEAQEDVQNTELRRWTLSPRQIAKFRRIEKYIKYYENSKLLSEQALSQFKNICERFADGQLTLELFIDEMNSTAKLIFNEQQ